MLYETYTDLELCALLLKTADQIEAAKEMITKESEKVADAFRVTRGQICAEMNRRLEWNLEPNTLIQWAKISIKESGMAENHSKKAA